DPNLAVRLGPFSGLAHEGQTPPVGRPARLRVAAGPARVRPGRCARLGHQPNVRPQLPLFALHVAAHEGDAAPVGRNLRIAHEHQAIQILRHKRPLLGHAVPPMLPLDGAPFFVTFHHNSRVSCTASGTNIASGDSGPQAGPAGPEAGAARDGAAGALQSAGRFGKIKKRSPSDVKEATAWNAPTSVRSWSLAPPWASACTWPGW